MSDTYIKATIGTTGLSNVTFRLYQGITIVVTDVAMPEVSGEGGLYAAQVPGGTAPGIYDVQVLIGGVAKGASSITWDGVKIVTADGRALYQLPQLQRA